MSRRHRVCCLLAAVLAVLFPAVTPAAAAPPPGRAVPVPAVPGAGAGAAVRSAGASVDPRVIPAAALADPAGPRGPSCAPGSPDTGRTPALPPRAGQDHAPLPAARPAPEEGRPHGTMPVRGPVRGPDRPAPGPVELSVMRI
ncbi:hypothetical protein AB0D46_00180 [Streptomyces sp. NPDC048383]|uniref:hypothetical protein n=1 Tax=Streptomyces sp. NPDC048383 TaxID=3155386 RepID=UPI003447E9F0